MCKTCPDGKDHEVLADGRCAVRNRDTASKWYYANREALNARRKAKRDAEKAIIEQYKKSTQL